MTFIASVKARNGVAVIADSLVTTNMPILTFEKYNRFITSTKRKSIEFFEIEELFESQAHHTNDYEEKLVMFDEFTAVTTAGSARIKDQRMSEIISAFVRAKAGDAVYGSLIF